MRTVQEIKVITEKWVHNVVVGLNFCPFAARPLIEKRVRFSVVESADITNILEAVIQEMQLLDREEETETSLVIIPYGFDNFNDYLSLLQYAQTLLKDQGYEGTYQLASFHPDYCFEGTDESDPANYTNRSPFPVIHIIREESLEKALRTFKNPESIPQRNIELARLKGISVMKNLLAASFQKEE